MKGKTEPSRASSRLKQLREAPRAKLRQHEDDLAKSVKPPRKRVKTLDVSPAIIGRSSSDNTSNALSCHETSTEASHGEIKLFPQDSKTQNAITIDTEALRHKQDHGETRAQVTGDEFPIEIWRMILREINNHKELLSLACTSRFFYKECAPVLYEQVYVVAPGYQRMPRVIKTLQRFLTIEQKKRMLDFCEYRGQEKSFPNDIDEDAAPINASYVRLFEIGRSHPGRSHRQTLVLFAQEAIKQFRNLEQLILIDMPLYPDMTNSIISLQHLKRLSITLNVRVQEKSLDGKHHNLLPLVNITGLSSLEVHLSETDVRDGLHGVNLNGVYVGQATVVLRAMLISNQSTLECLHLQALGCLWGHKVLQDTWNFLLAKDIDPGEYVKVAGRLDGLASNQWCRPFYLDKLKTLSIAKFGLSLAHAEAFPQHLDFEKLHALQIGCSAHQILTYLQTRDQPFNFENLASLLISPYSMNSLHQGKDAVIKNVKDFVKTLPHLQQLDIDTPTSQSQGIDLMSMFRNPYDNYDTVLETFSMQTQLKTLNFHLPSFSPTYFASAYGRRLAISAIGLGRVLEAFPLLEELKVYTSASALWISDESLAETFLPVYPKGKNLKKLLLHGSHHFHNPGTNLEQHKDYVRRILKSFLEYEEPLPSVISSSPSATSTVSGSTPSATNAISTSINSHNQMVGPWSFFDHFKLSEIVFLHPGYRVIIGKSFPKSRKKLEKPVEVFNDARTRSVCFKMEHLDTDWLRTGIDSIDAIESWLL